MIDDPPELVQPAQRLVEILAILGLDPPRDLGLQQRLPLADHIEYAALNRREFGVLRSKVPERSHGKADLPLFGLHTAGRSVAVARFDVQAGQLSGGLAIGPALQP